MNQRFNDYMKMSLAELEQTFVHLMHEDDLFWAFVVFIEYAQKNEFISDEVLSIYAAIMTKRTIATLEKHLERKE